MTHNFKIGDRVRHVDRPGRMGVVNMFDCDGDPVIQWTSYDLLLDCTFDKSNYWKLDGPYYHFLIEHDCWHDFEERIRERLK